MKKLMFAFCFVFGGLVVNAQVQDTTSTQQEQYPTTMEATEDQDRERISSRDLPDGVKRSLEGTEYRGWLVNAAYRTTGTDNGVTSEDQGMQSDTTSVYGNEGNQTGAYGQEVYIVELKNGAQTKTVRFDKDGNPLDDQGMNDQDDQK